jgi:hypothetical protein
MHPHSDKIGFEDQRRLAHTLAKLAYQLTCMMERLHQGRPARVQQCCLRPVGPLPKCAITVSGQCCPGRLRGCRGHYRDRVAAACQAHTRAILSRHTDLSPPQSERNWICSSKNKGVVLGRCWGDVTENKRACQRSFRIVPALATRNQLSHSSQQIKNKMQRRLQSAAAHLVQVQQSVASASLEGGRAVEALVRPFTSKEGKIPGEPPVVVTAVPVAEMKHATQQDIADWEPCSTYC